MPTFWNAVIPPIDDTWMMCPLRWARRNCSAAWVIHSAPKTLVSIWSRASCSDSSSMKPNWP
jgi:hypothetical protein